MLPGVLYKDCGMLLDKDGDFDGSFNVNFLKLSAAEKEENIELAKVVPFAATNVNLKRYEFADADRRPGTVWAAFDGNPGMWAEKRCSYGQLL